MIRDIDTILEDVKFISEKTSEIMNSYGLIDSAEEIPFKEKENPPFITVINQGSECCFW